MSVVIEGTTIVILAAALERRFPGGVAAFAQQVPNSTFHCDGELAAVSFMAAADTRLIIRVLTKHAFSDPWTAPSAEICIIDQGAGFLTQCGWLNVDLRMFSTADGDRFGATIAWIGDEPGRLAVPEGWRPRRVEQVSTADLQRNYELVKVNRDEAGGGTVTAYRHRETGRVLYIGRPAPADDDPEGRVSALGDELRPLLGMPASPQRHASAVDLCTRASKLVEATGGKDPRPLFIEGAAARLAERWAVAATAFRRAVELRPDFVDGWLELTWALAMLDRLEEAETAARRAVDLKQTSTAALGNLASVLLQRGRPEEALAAVERALELDPDEPMNRKIMEQVRRVLDHRAAEAEADVPWYRRWFR